MTTSELILPSPAAWLMIGSLLAGETYTLTHGHRGSLYRTASGITVTTELWPMGPVIGTRITLGNAP